MGVMKDDRVEIETNHLCHCRTYRWHMCVNLLTRLKCRGQDKNQPVVYQLNSIHVYYKLRASS